MRSLLRHQPLTPIVGAALVLCFLALAFTSGSNVWFGQVAYLSSAVLLGGACRLTVDVLAPPSRWAAVSALGGLMATEIYAATEIGVLDADEWAGVGALIVPAWLFAAVGWATHMNTVRSLRWVATLVQVSFTTLSAVLFAVLTARADSGLAAIGYGAATIAGSAAAGLAVLGIVQRINVELRRRAGARS